MKAEILDLLTEARARTFLLVSSLTKDELCVQHDPLMSPIIWDLGHIGHFEDVWLVEKLVDGIGEGEGLRGIYNPFENPRSTRAALRLPKGSELRDYLEAVRRRAQQILALHPDLEGASEDFFLYRMVLQHEYQHNETILQTLQLKKGTPYRPPRTRFFAPPASEEVRDRMGSMKRFPGGSVEIGTDDCGEAYDNERPKHTRQLDPFWIDTYPVTNEQYLHFMQEGGYEERSLWSDRGWEWRSHEGAVAPKYWTRSGEEWTIRVYDRRGPVDPLLPVQHVTFWEAEAYARFVGGRLPSEAEWEAAASWDPRSREKRPWPWGAASPGTCHANLDVLAFGPAPVGSFPDGASPIGCEQMIGDVWEWTSSDFVGYPGFQVFPYAEYSEVFFGDEYKVLRGGSWATRPGALRTTFRNWDYPIRRQIFSGFRCARDD